MRRGTVHIGFVGIAVLSVMSATCWEQRGMAAEDTDVAVLGIVQSDGNARVVNKSAAEAVVQRLVRIGERVWSKSLDLKKCELADDDCIVKAAPIPLRELIYGEITEQSGARTYELKLRRVDRGTGKEVSSQQGRCANCDAVALASRAAWLAGALYDRMTPLPEVPKETEAEPVKGPPVQPAPPVAQQPPVPLVPPVAEQRSGWTPKKAALAGAFGPLALVGLTTGIAFTAAAAGGGQVTGLDRGARTYFGFSSGGTIGMAVGSYVVALASGVIFSWAVEKRAE